MSKRAPLDTKPAFLEGFGHIGPALLGHLRCDAEVTPFQVKTTSRNTEVLDVGRTDLDNLVGLCRKCHTFIHTGQLKLAA